MKTEKDEDNTNTISGAESRDRAQRIAALWAKPLLADAEVAECLNLPESTWSPLKSRGDVPASFHLGRRKYCLTVDVLNWLHDKAREGHTLTDGDQADLVQTGEKSAENYIDKTRANFEKARAIKTTAERVAAKLVEARAQYKQAWKKFSDEALATAANDGGSISEATAQAVQKAENRVVALEAELRRCYESV